MIDNKNMSSNVRVSYSYHFILLFLFQFKTAKVKTVTHPLDSMKKGRQNTFVTSDIISNLKLHDNLSICRDLMIQYVTFHANRIF